MRYCSKDCQRVDWKAHREVCGVTGVYQCTLCAKVQVLPLNWMPPELHYDVQVEGLCNQCKKVAYCSVECKRMHWFPGGHREVCGMGTCAQCAKVLPFSTTTEMRYRCRGCKKVTYCNTVCAGKHWRYGGAGGHRRACAELAADSANRVEPAPEGEGEGEDGGEGGSDAKGNPVDSRGIHTAVHTDTPADEPDAKASAANVVADAEGAEGGWTNTSSTDNGSVYVLNAVQEGNVDVLRRLIACHANVN